MGKRAASNQLLKDAVEHSDDEEEHSGTWQKASAEKLRQRKMISVKRKKKAAASAELKYPSFNFGGGAPAPSFESLAQFTPETKPAEPSPVKPATPASSSTSNATEWECPSCTTSNKLSLAECAACESPRPDSVVVGDPEPKRKKPKSEAVMQEKVVPKITSFSAFQALCNDDNWECPACLVSNEPDLLKCKACVGDKPGHVSEKPQVAGFEFGGGAAGVTFGGGGEADGAAGVTFGAPAEGITFGAGTPAAGAEGVTFGSSAEGAEGVTFGGAEGVTFGSSSEGAEGVTFGGAEGVTFGSSSEGAEGVTFGSEGVTFGSSEGAEKGVTGSGSDGAAGITFGSPEPAGATGAVTFGSETAAGESTFTPVVGVSAAAEAGFTFGPGTSAPTFGGFDAPGDGGMFGAPPSEPKAEGAAIEGSFVFGAPPPTESKAEDAKGDAGTATDGGFNFSFSGGDAGAVKFSDFAGGSFGDFASPDATTDGATSEVQFDPKSFVSNFADRQTTPNEEFKDREQEKTGEEDDTVVFAAQSCRCFEMREVDGKNGKESKFVESGTGDLHVNTYKGKDGNARARVVMRTDKTRRLVLNGPLFPEMKFDIEADKFIKLATTSGEKLCVYLLRPQKADLQKLFEALKTVVGSLEKPAEEADAET